MKTLQSFLYTCESGTDAMWEARRALWRAQRLRGQVGIFQAEKAGDIPDRGGRKQCSLCRTQPTVWYAWNQQSWIAHCYTPWFLAQFGLPFTQIPAVSHPTQAACRMEQHWGMCSSLLGLMRILGNLSACTDRWVGCEYSKVPGILNEDLSSPLISREASCAIAKLVTSISEALIYL